MSNNCLSAVERGVERVLMNDATEARDAIRVNDDIQNKIAAFRTRIHEIDPLLLTGIKPRPFQTKDNREIARDSKSLKRALTMALKSMDKELVLIETAKLKHILEGLEAIRQT